MYVVKHMVFGSALPMKQKCSIEVHLNSKSMCHKERYLQSANVMVSSLDATQRHVFR